MSWLRLIKFESDGKVYYGEPEIDSAEDLPRLLREGNLFANAFVGESVFDLSTASPARKPVEKLLGILEPKDVPLIKCVGLNYIKHSKKP